MRVNVIGTRGFPHIQGGVEKHCEKLYTLIAQKGCNVKVFRRAPYVHNRNDCKTFHKVQFQDLWAPGHKNSEAIIHSLIATIICLYEKPDIVHIHNIGPSLVLPLLKLGHLTTVVTYHSPNYEHRKWGWFAKKVLMIGESFTVRWADKVVFVSKNQYESINCVNKVHVPNGVSIEPPSSSRDFLYRFGLLPDKYILAVGRFVPEKGLDDLIKAFKNLECDHRLVIVGDADHQTVYSRNLQELAKKDKHIILTGYLTGEPLRQLYSHAGLFVLPSHHEGLPIVLLEAMSYGLPVLVSDIPANKEVDLPDERYFRCGDVDDLKDKMLSLLENTLSEKERQELRKQIVEKYNWDKIAEQTIKVYEEALNRRN